MKRILKVIQLLILLPFHITNGSKRKAYKEVKKTMVDASLI